MKARSRHDATGWLARRLAVVCSSIMLAAVFLAVAPGVQAGDSSAATSLLDRSRRAASGNEFHGTMVVEWRDGGHLRTRHVAVRMTDGVLHMGDNRVVSAGSRRLLKTSSGWQLLWSGSSKVATPDPTRKYRFHVAHRTSVAGRAATPVVIERAGKPSVRERLFFDQASGLLLRRDQFDENGRLVRRVAFTEISAPQPAPVPSVVGVPRASSKPANRGPWALREVPDDLNAPKRIGDDFVLLGMYGQPGGSTQLYYSDGLVGLSVFETAGELAWGDLPAGGRSTTLGGTRARVYPTAAGSAVVWEQNDVTYTCVTDGPMDEVAGVAADFARSDEPSTLDDIGRYVTGPFSWG
jgi:negative regulator of sigma E activity